MYIYKFTIRMSVAGAAPSTKRSDPVELYVAANTLRQACSYAFDNINHMGCVIEELSGKSVFVHDIRAECDHATN